jgi:hypothetical protein
MSCYEDGSIIVTIAVVAHGLTIETDLSPEIQRTFQNVRLFSKSGGINDSFDSIFDSYLESLNRRFQQPLTEPTIKLMEEYSDRLRGVYQDDIEINNHMSREPEKIKSDSVCRIFDNVTVDKIISKTTSLWGQMLECVYPRSGVFVISVHKKVSSDNLQLLYPLPGNKPNLNLFNLIDFQEFSNLFPSRTPLPIEEMSMLSSNLSEIVKRYEPNIEEIREQIARWHLTLSSDERNISEIRLSYLLQLIKYVVGDECKTNIFDYSCSGPSRFFSDSDRQALQYIDSGDIENPPDRSWGGFSKKTSKKTRRKTRRKNKKNRRKSKRVKYICEIK